MANNGEWKQQRHSGNNREKNAKILSSWHLKIIAPRARTKPKLKSFGFGLGFFWTKSPTPSTDKYKRALNFLCWVKSLVILYTTCWRIVKNVVKRKRIREVWWIDPLAHSIFVPSLTSYTKNFFWQAQLSANMQQIWRKKYFNLIQFFEFWIVMTYSFAFYIKTNTDFWFALILT
jgi:hypothetical protein